MYVKDISNEILENYCEGKSISDCKNLRAYIEFYNKFPIKFNLEIQEITAGYYGNLKKNIKKILFFIGKTSSRHESQSILIEYKHMLAYISENSFTTKKLFNT